MGQNANIPNFADATQFKVAIGQAAFVIPDTVEAVSPAGALTGGISSSGLSPVNLFNTKRNTIGGYLFVAISDVAGPAALDFQAKVNPGDSVVLTVAASIATVQITDVNGNVRTPFSFPYTTVGYIQGYYA